MLIMSGEGSNGKSVVCAVLAALVGEENTSHSPVRSFADSFGLEPLLDKLVNITAETDGMTAAAEALVKLITAGDGVSVNRKNRPAVQGRLLAKVVVAANELPAFHDSTSGIWRRLLLIPFNVQISEQDADEDLGPRIIRNEMPGVARWAVEGLTRLRRQGKFTQSAASTNALTEYQKQRSPSKRFLSEWCVEEPDGFVAKRELYGSYVAWAKQNRFSILNADEFEKDVRRVFRHVGVTRPGKTAGGPSRPRAFQGIRLQSGCSSPAPQIVGAGRDNKRLQRPSVESRVIPHGRTAMTNQALGRSSDSEMDGEHDAYTPTKSRVA